MRFKLIGCEVLYRELCDAVARAPHVIDVEFLPKGLHDRGGAGMRTELQRRIDAVDGAAYSAVFRPPLHSQRVLARRQGDVKLTGGDEIKLGRLDISEGARRCPVAPARVRQVTARRYGPLGITIEDGDPQIAPDLIS